MAKNNLSKIRNLMNSVGYEGVPLQALIITNHDAHMSEYLTERDKRLQYVSGFSGSFGTVIITEKKAHLWTDGRYFIQANQEMDDDWCLMKVGVHGTPTEGTWLRSNLSAGSLVGTDATLIPYSAWLSIEKDLENSGITLVPLNINFVDRIWEDQPPLNLLPVVTQDFEFAGETCASKFERISTLMRERGIDLLVLSALDDICWLLNLRGKDILFNPVFFSFLIIKLEKELHLFVDGDRMPNAFRSYFEVGKVTIIFHPYDAIYPVLESMVSMANKCCICRAASYKIYSIIPASKRICDCSPVAVMKACKNDTEVKGMINAHIKDGIALCRFFAWLEQEMFSQASVSEVSAAAVLDSFRTEEACHIGPSFRTISSSGPNAAIIHYVPTEKSDRKLSLNEIYLCDSGGQYLDGTTDVTRTVHFGVPTDFQKECFTRVFQGLVSLATAVFPFGIKGNCLDSFARKPLWDAGLEYKHGTGHGIGSYLLVHEGPMGISWRPYPDDPGLQSNMFLSDEPGYYHENEFGIRIENIVRVVPAKPVYSMFSSEKGFLTFDTITLCPIQIKMLKLSILTSKEINYLNKYHQKVRDTLGPILIKRGYTDAYEWMERETRRIEESNITLQSFEL